MTDSDAEREMRELDATKRGISRRTVLQTAGGTAAAGLGTVTLTGGAAATEDLPQIVFCGCTQVCWCIEYCNVLSVRTEEEWIHFSDERFSPGVGYEMEHCYEIGDELTKTNGEELTVDGEKIIAVRVQWYEHYDHDDDSGEYYSVEEYYCNPHTCAERALDDDTEVDCNKWGDMGRDVDGGCGHPPCDHPARDSQGDTDEECET